MSRTPLGRGFVPTCLLAFCALLASCGSDNEHITPWDKPASVDGDVVTLTYTGSRCRESVDAAVVESSEQVVITVTEKLEGDSCVSESVGYGVEVKLDEPLGDRALVDGACDVAELEGRIECDPKASTAKAG